MRRGLGARAESFLLLLRGDPNRNNHSQDDHTDQRDAGKPMREDDRVEREKDRRKKLGAFRSLPLFRVSFLRAGDKTVVAGQGRAVERRPSVPYESDDDDDSSYAEDFNHDSGRVNSRSRRRRRRTTSKQRSKQYDESDSASAARGSSSHEEADSEEACTSDGSEDESSEECVVVNSSDESEEEDSDESSYEEYTDSDESSGEEDGKLERAQLRREARLLRKEKERRERERERMMTAEEKRRHKVEKRKLRKVEEQRKREGLEELQRQIQKLRAERELKKQEEKDLKELRRIDKLLAKEREKEEKKARKLQEKEQRHREKILKQKQVRELILARLGRPAAEEDVPHQNADSISRETQGLTTLENREASSVALLHLDEQEVELGRQVDTDGEQADHRATARDAREDQVKTVGFSVPSIKGIPSRGGPAQEVLIAVTERRPSTAPRNLDAEPAEEETEEAEDEDEGDAAGGRRAVNNRGRVTDIPALRITGKMPVAAKRSPASKMPHASSAQLIRGLIGFDELEDALFELNRQVEELRSLTS